MSCAAGGIVGRAQALLLLAARWLAASLRLGCCGAGKQRPAETELGSSEKQISLEDDGRCRTGLALYRGEACDQDGYWGTPHDRAGSRQAADAAPRQRRASHGSTQLGGANAAAIAMQLSLCHSNLSAFEEEEPCQASGEGARESRLVAQGEARVSIKYLRASPERYIVASLASCTPANARRADRGRAREPLIIHAQRQPRPHAAEAGPAARSGHLRPVSSRLASGR
jgi:hypothetical protein